MQNLSPIQLGLPPFLGESAGYTSQPAGRAAKGSGACSLEIFEKQVLGCAILVFFNVFEVVSGIHFNNIFNNFSHFNRIYLTVVGKLKGNKKV